jgi:hypothetical protein
VPPQHHKRARVGTSTTPADRLAATSLDHVWALDYQFDVTATGRVIKILHVVDEFTPGVALGPGGALHRRRRHRRHARRHRRRPWTPPPLHPLRQRSRAHCQRPEGLVPLRRRRHQLHRPRLALAEPLGRVLRLSVRESCWPSSSSTPCWRLRSSSPTGGPSTTTTVPTPPWGCSPEFARQWRTNQPQLS